MLTPKYVPSAIIRVLPGNKLVGVRQQTPPAINAATLDFELSLADIAILELFAFHAEPEAVWRQLTSLDYKNSGLAPLYMGVCKAEPRLEEAKSLQLYLGKQSVRCTGFVTLEQGKGNTLWKENLTEYAAKDPRVAVAALLSRMEGLAVEVDSLADYAKFLERIQALREAGFITPEVGSLDWGDLRRLQPLCQFFGFTRGTPVDRYYLDRFVESIGQEVRGITLEIGGEKRNRELYGFTQATEYRVLDLPGLSDDIAGDVSNRNTLSESSLDSIVMFNVLEHCEHPQTVVDNIHHWLKPGGKAFVLVPTAQKIHPAPRDYWRPLPHGLDSLFKGFSGREIRTYGNIATVIASFHGVAAEELTREELEFNHPDYPVTSCITAQK
jgi:SAM-dependent methyltransferase